MDCNIHLGIFLPTETMGGANYLLSKSITNMGMGEVSKTQMNKQNIAHKQNHSMGEAVITAYC